MTYYSAILAWAAYYFGASFSWPLPWAVAQCGETDLTCRADPQRALPLKSSSVYFNKSVLQTNLDSLESGIASTISGPLYGSAPPMLRCRTLTARFPFSPSTSPAQLHC